MTVRYRAFATVASAGVLWLALCAGLIYCAADVNKESHKAMPKNINGLAGVPVRLLAYSPKLKLLASVPDVINVRPDKPPGILIQVWNPTTGILKDTLFGQKGNITFIDFADDRRSLVWVEGSQIRSWDAATNTTRNAAVRLTKRSGANFSGAAFFTWNDDEIAVWDWRKGVVQRRLNVPSLGSQRLSVFSASGAASAKQHLFAIGGGLLNEVVVVWDYTTGSVKSVVKQKDTLFLTFSRAGDYLFCSGNVDRYYGRSMLQIWDTDSWKLLHTIEGGECELRPVIDLPKGQAILCVATYRRPAPKNTSGDDFLYSTVIVAYSIKTGKKVAAFDTGLPPDGCCSAVCYMEDYDAICIGGMDGNLTFFSVEEVMKKGNGKRDR